MAQPKQPTKGRPSFGLALRSGISPTETGVKYQSRLTEAKAMMSKIRFQLNSSKNTSRVIIKEVTEAAERLVQLVIETEMEKRQSLDKGAHTSKEGAIEVEQGMEAPQTQDMGCREDNILEFVKKNHQMLLKNQAQMSDLMKRVEEQAKSMDRTVSYASVLTEGKKSPVVVNDSGRKSLHSIAVMSKNETETGEEVLEKVRQAVEAKEGWVRVERVRKAKDRKVIMGCSTEEERDKIKSMIEKAGRSLIVEDMKNKDPLLILKGVLKMHTNEEVVRALKNQNREVFHGLDSEKCRMEIKYRKRTRNPHTDHVILTVSPIIWARAVEQGRMRIDLQSVLVEDQSPLVQCSRCLMYGHSRRFCGEAVDLCSHCGGTHLRSDCPERAEGGPPKCLNCVRAGRTDTGHNTFFKECPVRKTRDRIARASVQYC